MKTHSFDRQAEREILFAAVKIATQDAIETHRRMGRAIVTWKNGAVKWVQPHEIEPRPLSSEIDAQNTNHDA